MIPVRSLALLAFLLSACADGSTEPAALEPLPELAETAAASGPRPPVSCLVTGIAGGYAIEVHWFRTPARHVTLFLETGSATYTLDRVRRKGVTYFSSVYAPVVVVIDDGESETGRQDCAPA